MTEKRKRGAPKGGANNFKGGRSTKLTVRVPRDFRDDFSKAAAAEKKSQADFLMESLKEKMKKILNKVN